MNFKTDYLILIIETASLKFKIYGNEYCIMKSVPTSIAKINVYNAAVQSGLNSDTTAIDFITVIYCFFKIESNPTTSFSCKNNPVSSSH